VYLKVTVYNQHHLILWYCLLSLPTAKLNLQDNKLEGKIPESLYNSTIITNLVLEGNPLTGSIGPSIANMAFVKELSLGRSGLEGELPAELFTLPRLEVLHLNDASFSGPLLVDRFVQLADTLVSLWLFNNNFSGDIPVEAFLVMDDLEELALHGNPLLTGNITVELCNLRGTQPGQIDILRVDCRIPCGWEGCCDTCSGNIIGDRW